MKAIAKSETDGSIPPAGNVGTPAGIESEHEEIKYCAHRGYACINQQGYRCLHAGPCQPVDSEGRRFVLYHWIENGQRLAHRHYLNTAAPAPAVKRAPPIIIGS